MWIRKKKYMAEIERAERRGAEKYYPYYRACKRLEHYIEAEQKRGKIVKFMEAKKDA